MIIAIDIRPMLERKKTGISGYTENLVNHLVETNEHRFVLFYNSWRTVIPDSWQRKNVTVRRFRWPNKLFNTATAFLSEPFLDDLIPEADYFLFPNLNFFRLCRKPYGVVMHDLSFVLFPKFFKLKSRLWHALIDLPSILKSARDIMVVSKNTKADLLAFYELPTQKIRAIYPGVTSISLIPVSKAAEPYFLFLGRLEERKNILGLIEAFLKFKEQKPESNFSLILAGPLDQHSTYSRQILKLVGPRSDIKITGYLSPEEKQTLLAKAYIFLYPSFYEGFGFPPLEAQACGVPVIASNNSSLSEVIGSSGLLIDPYSQEDLTRAMSEMASNASLRNRYIEEGYKNVKRFNWNNTIDQIKNIMLYAS